VTIAMSLFAEVTIAMSLFAEVTVAMSLFAGVTVAMSLFAEVTRDIVIPAQAGFRPAVADRRTTKAGQWPSSLLL
jgi:hypothetical protein